MCAVREAKRVDVHQDVVNGVLGLLVVHDVRLAAVTIINGLVAEVGADFGHQSGV